MTTRRDLLTAAPAAALLAGTTGSALAGDHPESEIMRLFGEWHARYLAFEAGHHLRPGDDEAADRLSDEMHEIMQQIALTPARDMRDFAAKMVAITNFGDFDLCGHWAGVAIYREALAAIGVENDLDWVDGIEIPAEVIGRI